MCQNGMFLHLRHFVYNFNHIYDLTFSDCFAYIFLNILFNKTYSQLTNIFNQILFKFRFSVFFLFFQYSQYLDIFLALNFGQKLLQGILHKHFSCVFIQNLIVELEFCPEIKVLFLVEFFQVINKVTFKHVRISPCIKVIPFDNQTGYHCVNYFFFVFFFPFFHLCFYICKHHLRLFYLIQFTFLPYKLIFYPNHLFSEHCSSPFCLELG